jgi:integrase
MQRVLADRFVQTVKPPRSGRAEYVDVRVPGLVLRVTHAGAKSWSFRFRDPTRGGKPLARATIGTFPATSLKEARERAGEMRKLVEAGRNPLAASSGIGSFGALASRYMVEHSTRKKRSHEGDQRNLNLHVLPQWRDKTATSITRLDVIELLEGILRAGKPTLANRVQSLVSSIFTFGMGLDAKLVANPCHRLPKRGTENVGSRVLSDDEIRLFWNGVATSGQSKHLGLALRLTLLTAARVSEIAGLCRSELDLSEPGRSTWEIPGSRTKNSKTQLIPLSPLALDTVLELLALIDAKEQYLFPTRSIRRRGPISGHSITRAMAYFSQRLTGDAPAVQTWQADAPSPHDLRRTVETQLAKLRIPKEIRDRCLNHVPGDVGAKHYNKYDYFDEKAEAFNRLSLSISAMVNPSPSPVIDLATARERQMA